MCTCGLGRKCLRMPQNWHGRGENGRDHGGQYDTVVGVSSKQQKCFPVANRTQDVSFGGDISQDPVTTKWHFKPINRYQNASAQSQV